jgi:hypothetical protein
MMGAAHHLAIPLPKGWPRRVRSAITRVISPACGARQIIRSRVLTWPSWHRCRVAPGRCLPGALARSGQGDFHHPAPPLMRLVAMRSFHYLRKFR